ncbi:MAG: hypothetical protein CMG04_08000 [Candidatus Marinimicrobia bacterium]|nr:hypothetical protein [Candidatus Neomarinimicrobiota bacterium]
MGHWLNSLTFFDHLVIFILFIISIFLSKQTLKTLLDYYKTKTKEKLYTKNYRITPASNISLAIVYTIVLYNIINSILKIN